MQLILLVTVSITVNFGDSGDVKGHLKPLGSHRHPIGSIETVLKRDITSNLFLHGFVKQNKPIVIRGLLRNSKPVLTWSDEYLKRHFGEEEITVDHSKLGRANSSSTMSLGSFISTYNTSKTYYLIDTLPIAMQEEMEFPAVLHTCEICSKLQDFVLWFSGGQTSSKLHYDKVENLYCQIDGSKSWFMSDPVHGKDKIPIDKEAGAYSSINVSAVDMDKYPGMQEVEYFLTMTYPGDCIYVPVDWFHQVNSAPQRNLAVNIWWAPILDGDADRKCVLDFKITEESVLADLSFNPGEWLRYLLTTLFDQTDRLNFQQVRRLVVHEHTGECLIDQHDFDRIDSNSDNMWSLYDILKSRPDVIYDVFDESNPGAVNVNGKAEREVVCDFDLKIKEEL